VGSHHHLIQALQSIPPPSQLLFSCISQQYKHRHENLVMQNDRHFSTW
jgi:hypothetical protein